jgi:hypothetical protein
MADPMFDLGGRCGRAKGSKLLIFVLRKKIYASRMDLTLLSRERGRAITMTRAYTEGDGNYGFT